MTEQRNDASTDAELAAHREVTYWARALLNPHLFDTAYSRKKLAEACVAVTSAVESANGPGDGHTYSQDLHVALSSEKTGPKISTPEPPTADCQATGCALPRIPGTAWCKRHVSQDDLIEALEDAQSAPDTSVDPRNGAQGDPATGPGTTVPSETPKGQLTCMYCGVTYDFDVRHMCGNPSHDVCPALNGEDERCEREVGHEGDHLRYDERGSPINGWPNDDGCRCSCHKNPFKGTCAQCSHSWDEYGYDGRLILNGGTRSCDRNDLHDPHPYTAIPTHKNKRLRWHCPGLGMTKVDVPFGPDRGVFDAPEAKVYPMEEVMASQGPATGKPPSRSGGSATPGPDWKALADQFASNVRATLSCKACSAVLPHHNGLQFSLADYDAAVSTEPVDAQEER